MRPRGRPARRSSRDAGSTRCAAVREDDDRDGRVVLGRCRRVRRRRARRPARGRRHRSPGRARRTGSGCGSGSRGSRGRRGAQRPASRRSPSKAGRNVGRPVGQQVVEDREEALLGRVPGLEDVVVEPHLVDRLDRHLGIGVGGEQDALGVGLELERLRAGTRCPSCRGMRWSTTNRPIGGAAHGQLPRRLERLLAAAGAPRSGSRLPYRRGGRARSPAGPARRRRRRGWSGGCGSGRPSSRV